MMTHHDNCKGCGHHNHCQEIFERIAKAAGPSVAVKAFLAFLLPLLVFAVSLAGFGWLLEKLLENPTARIIADFALALAATLAAIRLLRFITAKWY
ncbi:MAG: hypothetical protein ABIG61_14120 [Planctomycetota bacterium]